MRLGIGIGLTLPRQVGGGVNESAFTTEANSYLTRATTANGSALTATYQVAVDTMIRELKADGSWDKISYLLNFAAPSQAVALLDWKQDRTATTSGTVTFTANSDFDFGTNTSHIDTGVAGGTQDDAHYSVRLGTYTYLSDRALVHNTGNTVTLKTPVTTNTGNLPSRMHSNTQVTGTSALFTNLTGHNFMVRNNSADYRLRNGANSETITRVSAAAGTSTIRIGGTTAVVLALDNTPYHGFTMGAATSTTQEDTISAAYANFRAFAFQSETTSLLARMTTQPSAGRQKLINDLIKSLKDNGIWTKLDALYILAAHEADSARLNWKSTSFNLTAVNSPTFTVDRGYTGDGSTSYLDTAFTPSTAPTPQFVQDSAHLAFWSRTAAQWSNPDMGCANALLWCRNTVDNIQWRINAGTTISTGPSTDGSGLFVGSRTGATTSAIYRNGSQVGSTNTAASTAVDSNAIRILARSGSAQFSNRQVAASSIGAGLSAAEVTNLYNALNTYLTAVGAA